MAIQPGSTPAGQIVILNGAPRSGKSSIVTAVQASFDGIWMNLGVDTCQATAPEQLRPGIGLRPGGERPDIESQIQVLYGALYETIAAHSRLGLNVIADVGHHDAYAKPRHILVDCARRLQGLPVLFVGVYCPIEMIMERRNAGHPGRVYTTGSPSDPVPEPVLRWQNEVHRPGIYDLKLDTSMMSPTECAQAIRQFLSQKRACPTAFERLAALQG